MSKNRGVRERGTHEVKKCRANCDPGCKKHYMRKLLVEKLIYKMFRMKLSTDAYHTFTFISSWDKKYYKAKKCISNSGGVSNCICLITMLCKSSVNAKLYSCLTIRQAIFTCKIPYLTLVFIVTISQNQKFRIFKRQIRNCAGSRRIGLTSGG